MNKLNEFTIPDFKAQASELTKHYRKVRDSIKGKETRLAKLVELDPNKGVFVWITEPTGSFSVPIFDPKTNTEKKANLYVMQIQVLGLSDWYEKTQIRDYNEFKYFLADADIKLSCDCMGFHWQGSAYNLTELESAIYPVTIKDEVWRDRHDGGALLCKHLLGIVNKIGAYHQGMFRLTKLKL